MKKIIPLLLMCFLIIGCSETAWVGGRYHSKQDLPQKGDYYIEKDPFTNTCVEVMDVKDGYVLWCYSSLEDAKNEKKCPHSNGNSYTVEGFLAGVGMFNQYKLKKSKDRCMELRV